MVNRKIAHIHQIARFVLAFVFIYHGLVPKILYLSPVEAQLTNAHHFGYSADLIALMAGSIEILLGLLLLCLRKTLVPVYSAIILLLGFLLDVVFIMPSLLIEAFNPLTINVVAIVVGYIIIITSTRCYLISYHINEVDLSIRC